MAQRASARFSAICGTSWASLPCLTNRASWSASSACGAGTTRVSRDARSRGACASYATRGTVSGGSSVTVVTSDANDALIASDASGSGNPVISRNTLRTYGSSLTGRASESGVTGWSAEWTSGTSLTFHSP